MNYLDAIRDRDFQKLISDAIANALSAVAQKASLNSASTTNYLHGISSLFGGAQIGIDPEVVSTVMQWRGVGNILPRVATPMREVFLPFITGVAPTSSVEQYSECGDCISGETTACIQHFPSARICRETKQMTITRVIERLNSGDINLSLLNRQLGAPWNPSSNMSQLDLMQVAVAWSLLYELPALFAQKLSRMMYTGNPTNNTDGYREFRGLEQLVNTGFVDAFTNIACPSLDSDVKNFNYGNVATANNPSFFDVLEMAHYYVLHNAIEQGLDPVEHVVVMRPELWQIVSQLVPAQRIQMALLNCAATSDLTISISGTEIANEREQLRRSMVIPLNGEMVKVVTDSGITEYNHVNDSGHLASGEYASDVYILPIRYLGNRDALQYQYKDYRLLAGEIEGTNNLLNGFYRYTDDGMFAWAIVQNGACFKIQMFTEPRLVLRTPQLAARIENVKYVPLQHLRSPDPNSPYGAKGGVSYRIPDSFYH